jgi:hypothetical protein
MNIHEPLTEYIWLTHILENYIAIWDYIFEFFQKKLGVLSNFSQVTLVNLACFNSKLVDPLYELRLLVL